METRKMYITVGILVECPNDSLNEDIVSELDYSFSSFDENVKVIDTEICGLND